MGNNKSKKLITLMLFILFSTILIVGCEKREQPKDSKETVSDSSKHPSKEAVTTKELPIYCLQEETLEREPVAAIIPADAEIDAAFVVNTVVDIFEERSLPIGIDSVTSEKDIVIVNFKKNVEPVTNTGTSAESGILDCISMSLLDNVESCQKVIFRIEGEAYVTGHMAYEIDEPYKTLNK